MGEQVKNIEEQYILRVLDEDLRNELRQACRDESVSDVLQRARLSFPDSDQEGTLEWRGRSYPVLVLDLPCVTESYKTYDDINLVKTTDIGQVLVVGASKEQRERLTGQGRFVNESLDGIGPPMRDARARLFRDDPEVDAETVAKVEFDLLTILAGGAPAGMQFVDYEEVWKVDPETGKGEWVPAS